MSNVHTQAVQIRVDVKVADHLDLQIRAVDTAVVRLPFSAGAMDQRATKVVLAIG